MKIFYLLSDSFVLLRLNKITKILNNIIRSDLGENSFIMNQNVLIYEENYINDEIITLSSANFTLNLKGNKFTFLGGLQAKIFLKGLGRNLTLYLENNDMNNIYYFESFILLNQAGFHVEIVGFQPSSSNIRFFNLFSSIIYKDVISLL